MSRVDWVVCERSGQWTGALRAALGRSGWSQSAVPRVFEVRQLGELTAHLDKRPDDLALVEVRRENVSAVLEWLAVAGRNYRRARVVALADRSLWESEESEPEAGRRDRQQVVDALFEAGAAEVVTSPRQLQGALRLGQRQASLRVADLEAPTAWQSIEEWAWLSLPWQDE
jgi:hypothetical protein